MSNRASDQHSSPAGAETVHPGPFTGLPPSLHALSAEQVAAQLCRRRPQGLSAGEAAERQARYGPNELAQAPPPARWKLFFGQFRSAVVWLLIAAALVSGALGEWADTVAILAIVAAQRSAGISAGR